MGAVMTFTLEQIERLVAVVTDRLVDDITAEPRHWASKIVEDWEDETLVDYLDIPNLSTGEREDVVERLGFDPHVGIAYADGLKRCMLCNSVFSEAWEECPHCGSSALERAALRAGADVRRWSADNLEHPDYPRADWLYEAGNGDTSLGYDDWAKQKEDAG